MTELHEKKGPIAWMAKNPVAANLLMLFLILGGILTSFRIKQEVFPELELDMVQILVPYPGASPEEVEKGIIKAIEEEVRGLDGVERVTATASEGFGSVIVELLLGTDANKALQDVKNAVDRIVTFPELIERPRVSLLSQRRAAISLMVYGDLEEGALRRLAEQVRAELLAHDGITLVDLAGVRPLEIHIEIPQETLRKYNLTLGDVAAKVRRTALELPGGGVKTQGGEILLRLAERRDAGADFASIPILSDQDGTEVLLGNIARIVDGFRDTDEASSFNGKPAAQVVVYRTGDQTPIEVADIVKEYIKRLEKTLPEGAGVSIWRDWSDIYRQRLSLLLRNAYLGLVLVLVLLGLFLEVRLAFWVTMGIPTSFLGAMLLLPGYDISINMISMFAFIMTLGMVVDDAIVVGENVYEMRQRGVSGVAAAIAGDVFDSHKHGGVHADVLCSRGNGQDFPSDPGRCGVGVLHLAGGVPVHPAGAPQASAQACAARRDGGPWARARAAGPRHAMVHRPRLRARAALCPALALRYHGHRGCRAGHGARVLHERPDRVSFHAAGRVGVHRGACGAALRLAVAENQGGREAAQDSRPGRARAARRRRHHKGHLLAGHGSHCVGGGFSGAGGCARYHGNKICGAVARSNRRRARH
jgi:hypothetical protein